MSRKRVKRYITPESIDPDASTRWRVYRCSVSRCKEWSATDQLHEALSFDTMRSKNWDIIVHKHSNSPDHKAVRGIICPKHKGKYGLVYKRNSEGQIQGRPVIGKL